MSALADKPSVHVFPKNIMHDTIEAKQQYFDEVFGGFVDTFVLQKQCSDYNGEEDDYTMNYGM